VNGTRVSANRQPSALIVGVEFDRANISAALIDDRAHILTSEEAQTPQRTTRAAVATLTKLILDVASSKERGKSAIGAVGISVSGLIDPSTERVTVPGLKGWTRVALSQLIGEGLSDSGYDIRTPNSEKRARAQHSPSSHPAMTIHSQAACLAAAESWYGAARGKGNVIYVSIGEEVEVGILINGRALRGSNGWAGSAAWLGLSENFRPEYQSRGCLATEATIPSLTRRAIEEWSGSSSTMLGKLIKADPTQLDVTTIIRAARGKDALALKVINETCRWIGRGIANLSSILDPQAVVIGGQLGLSLKPFLDEIRKEAHRWLPPEVANHCRIVSPALNERAGALGAARFAQLKSISSDQ